jgi:hypothetical protein
MIIYKCDGESFGGKKCSNEVTRDMPEWWLMICGKIKNGLHDAHYIEANGTYHFCSRNCLENFFFKNENAARASQGTTYMNIDPGTKQEEAVSDVAETVTEGTPAEAQDAEEGTTEG